MSWRLLPVSETQASNKKWLAMSSAVTTTERAGHSDKQAGPGAQSGREDSRFPPAPGFHLLTATWARLGRSLFLRFVRENAEAHTPFRRKGDLFLGS